MKSGSRKPHHKAGSTRIIGTHGRAADNSAEFHATLSAQFLQRYAELFQALAAPVHHVALLNSFTTVNDCDELGLTDRVCQTAGPISCLRFPDQPTSYPPPPSCPYTQLKQFYWIDFASVLPPLLLGVQPHHVVLDMCAAPGTKSLVLAMQLLLGQDTHSAGCGAAEGMLGGLTPELLQQLHVGTVSHPAPDAGGAAQHETGGPQQQQQQQQQLVQPDQQQPEQQQQQLVTSDSILQAAAAAAAGHDAACASIVGPVADVGGDASATSAATTIAAAAAADDDDDGQQSDGDSDQPAAVAGSSSSSSGQGRLVCNEVDPVRRSRLSGVLSGYIPGSLRRHVRVTGHDAAKHWVRFEGSLYDRVLLDAPCSSERHVVQAAVEAGGVVSSSSWSKQHCADLATLQLKLLMAGLRALKPGGRLMYTTCSILQVENDDVVQQALQHSQGTVKVVPAKDWALGSEMIVEAAGGETTQHGMICLPDRAGWGPIF